MFGTSTGTSGRFAAIDNHPGPGHQFQPAIACTGTRATAVWYDQRNDVAFSDAAVALGVLPVHHRSDAAAAGAHRSTYARHRPTRPGCSSRARSIQVSKYPIAYDSDGGSVVQLQYNFLNFALFGGGIVPFLGDYLEVVPKNPVHAAALRRRRVYADDRLGVQHLRERIAARPRPVDRQPRRAAARRCERRRTIDWTSTRAWRRGVQPGPSLTWTRNQNLYTSLLGGGFVHAGRGQRAAHQGSREARLCRADAEPGAAGARARTPR